MAFYNLAFFVALSLAAATTCLAHMWGLTEPAFVGQGEWARVLIVWYNRISFVSGISCPSRALVTGFERWKLPPQATSRTSPLHPLSKAQVFLEQAAPPRVLFACASASLVHALRTPP